MATEFIMPKLGLTMEEGTILRWLVSDGTEVTPGTPVLLIETDKVETEVEVQETGVFHPVGEPGQTFECGLPIGWILAPGEAAPGGAVAAPAAAAPAAAPVAVAEVAAQSAQAPPAPAAAAAPAASAPAPLRAPGERLLVSPNARRIANELGVDLATVSGSGPGGRIVSEDVERTALAAPSAPSEAASKTGAVAAGAAAAAVASVAAGVAAVGAAAATAGTASAPAPSVASPATVSGSGQGPLAGAAARLLADQLGLNLAEVPSSGPDGRVSRDDVLAHVRSLLGAAQPRSVAPAVSTSALPLAPLMQEPTETIPLRGMRGTIAQRMHGSLQSMAQLTLTMDVEMDAAVSDREIQKAGGSAPGFTDYVIAAAARAIAQHPIVNSQITEDGVAVLPQVNIGMAVALEGGLIVPVVHGADQLSVDEIALRTTDLAERARSGGLALSDLEGGTFSVTALGMFGVDVFTPVINPPNTAILGVGRIRTDTDWGDNGLQRVSRMTLSLTWDHRAFDGAPAAQFTQTIKGLLEDPSHLR